MDNKKIGKLIAILRKRQGLTQQELGDKVGVGFRAVSKWERGINCPDIGIINNLSKILGISSDELLSGKLKENKEPKHKIPTKIKITLSITLAIIIIVISLFIYCNNRTYVYEIKNFKTKDYYMSGKVNFNKNNISVIIDKIYFKDEKFLAQTISNYEYKILYKDIYIFGYGYTPNMANVETKTIKNTINDLKINYSGETELKRKDILENGLNIIMNFLEPNGSVITKKLELTLK